MNEGFAAIFIACSLKTHWRSNQCRIRCSGMMMLSQKSPSLVKGDLYVFICGEDSKRETAGNKKVGREKSVYCYEPDKFGSFYGKKKKKKIIIRQLKTTNLNYNYY